MIMKLLILNGPNLNLLGTREPDVYGSKTFEEFLAKLRRDFPQVELDYSQSNEEGVIVTSLQEADGVYSGVVLNAAAYTHTSIAIADAIAAISVPVIEVHISNVFAREEFRWHSVIAPYCMGSISGFGLQSYSLAVRAFIHCNSIEQ